MAVSLVDRQETTDSAITTLKKGLDKVTIVRTGSNKKFSEGWAKAFGSKSKKRVTTAGSKSAGTKKKSVKAAAKATVKKTAKKATAKKKTAKKKG